MSQTDHRCKRFRTERRAGPWTTMGNLRCREIERMGVCVECGRDRPARARRVVAVEREAAMRSYGPPDPLTRQLARKLLRAFRGRARLRAASLVRRFGGVRFEENLESFTGGAPLRLVYKPRSGRLELHELLLLDASGLAEIASPGAAARCEAALRKAQHQLEPCLHPEARAIAELLQSDLAATLDESMIRALSGLAALMETGEQRPARAFSVEVLGHSKALARIRSRLERMVGPLERLGIRHAGAIVLMGGTGRIHLRTCWVDLGLFDQIGLAATDVASAKEIELPPGGLLVVENLTPFHGCVERIGRGADTFVLWSGGFPNRGVRRVIEMAHEAGARVRVWCDLDLGGVRIARLLCDAASGAATPVLMGPAVLSAAQTRRRLTPEQRAALEREVRQRPAALLADTLRSLLKDGVWIEQEALLALIPHLRESSP